MAKLKNKIFFRAGRVVGPLNVAIAINIIVIVVGFRFLLLAQIQIQTQQIQYDKRPWM